MPRMSLELVVVAIVVLVVALVILTIFGTGIGPFGAFSSTQNLCTTQFTTTCQSTGIVPSDWSVPKYTVGNDKLSCAGIMSKVGVTCNCYAVGQSIPGSGAATVNTAICK
jgi:hypothetical protein